MSQPLSCFHVENYTHNGEEKSRWTEIGVAFVNKDKSLSVKLVALPVDGKLQIRKRKPREEGGQDQGQ